MRVKVWGARGSIPTPGPRTVRYGGNTSCVLVTPSDGPPLILDAGTGIRNLAFADGERPSAIHILLTHLHLDHIQGLLFFAPLFDPDVEVTIWGPPAPGGELRDRIARYLSAPLSPVEVRDLPCRLEFRECPREEWAIGSAVVRADAVNHRGPTVGYRIEDRGAALCYLPDHEPALAGPLDDVDDDWISGFALAHDADLLLHDCQYTDEEYPSHFGWGHSAVSDALRFALRTRARRTLLTHHDPGHSDDDLDALAETARQGWLRAGGRPHALELVAEQREIELVSRPRAVEA